MRTRRSERPWSQVADVDAVLALDEVDHPAIGAHPQPVERPRARRTSNGRRASPSIVSIIFCVPSGLPQRMQLTIAASFSTRGALRAPGVEIEPRHERDRVLGARRRADAALHALRLDEAHLRRSMLSSDRGLGARAHAREAHRARVAVDRDAAVRRSPRAAESPSRGIGACSGEMLDRQRGGRALLGRGRERRGDARSAARAAIAQSASSASAPTMRKCSPW